MRRRPGTGGAWRQAPGTTSLTSGLDGHAKTLSVAAPADLGLSLRVLDDD